CRIGCRDLPANFFFGDQLASSFAAVYGLHASCVACGIGNIDRFWHLGDPFYRHFSFRAGSSRRVQRAVDASFAGRRNLPYARRPGSCGEVERCCWHLSWWRNGRGRHRSERRADGVPPALLAALVLGLVAGGIAGVLFVTAQLTADRMIWNHRSYSTPISDR